MTDMWTDDEIAELFARANPVPASHRSPDQTAIELVAPKAVPGFDLDDHPVQPIAERGKHWGVVIGVAAATALVVSLLVATTVDEGQPVPVDEPVTTLATVPGVEEGFIDPVHATAINAFLAAIAEHDVDGAVELTTASAELDIAPGAVKPGQPIVDLAIQFGWMESFDWRWEDPTCAPGPDGDIECAIQVRNRLTEFSGVAYLARASFEFVGDRISSVTHIVEPSNYDDEAFRPYARWMQENHLDDVTRLWSTQGALLTAETAAIMDARLTEYIGQSGEELADEFIAAVNDADVEAARAVLAPDRTLQLVGTEDSSMPTLEAQFAWLRASGTTWDDSRCAAMRPNSVTCEFRYGNRLGRAQHAQAETGSVTFRTVDGGIEMTGYRPPWKSDAPYMDYDAFIYWVNATDPETAHRIWTDGDGAEIVTEATASLLDEQLSAFLASGAVDLEPDDTSARRLVAALNERDADALAAAVDDDLDAIDGWTRSTWSEMANWLDSNDDSWKVKACYPVAENTQACEIDVDDALSRFARVEKNRFAVLEIDGDVITSFSITTQSDDYEDGALRPFLDWLRTHHPDDFDEVWQDVDGEFVPRPTDRAAELHARHVAEYTSSEGES